MTESFYHTLKGHVIHGSSFATRKEVNAVLFDYIEMFYNSKRRHGSNGQRSPLDYEKAHQKMVMCV